MNLQTIGNGMMVASTVGIATSYALLPSDDDTRNTLIALFGRAILLGSFPTRFYEIRNAFHHRHVVPIHPAKYYYALFLISTIYFAFSSQSPVPSIESLKGSLNEFAKFMSLLLSFTHLIPPPTVQPPIFVDVEHEDYEPYLPSPIDPDGTLRKQSWEKLRAFCRVINVDPGSRDPEIRRLADDLHTIQIENIENPEIARERLGQLINRFQIGMTADDIPGGLRSLREQLPIAEQYLDASKKADRQKLADSRPLFMELSPPFMIFIFGSMALARITKPPEPNGEIEDSDAYYQAKDQGANFARLAQASHHLLTALVASQQAFYASSIAMGMIKAPEITDGAAAAAEAALDKQVKEMRSTILLCEAAHVVSGEYPENPFRTHNDYFYPKDEAEAGPAFNTFVQIAQEASKTARTLADDFEKDRDPEMKQTLITIAELSEQLHSFAEQSSASAGSLTKKGSASAGGAAGADGKKDA